MHAFVPVNDMRRVWDIDYDDLHMGEELGRGASGIVYAATWGGTRVAVKKLRGDIGMVDASVAELFSQEIDFMRTVRHVNIVMFFGAGSFLDGSPFLVRARKG